MQNNKFNSFKEAKDAVELGEVSFENVDKSSYSEDEIFELRQAQVVGYIRGNDIKVLIISAYAEAYYSGRTYSEDVVMLANDFINGIYKKVENPITDMDLYEDDEEIAARVYVGELDGKHSEVYADITVEYLTETEATNFDFSRLEADSNYLENYIFDYNSDLKKLCNENFEKYISKLDKVITKTVVIRESQIEQLKEFIEKLNTEKPLK